MYFYKKKKNNLLVKVVYEKITHKIQFLLVRTYKLI
jgi:hypothetical protein